MTLVPPLQVSTWGGADTELWSLDRGSFRLILGRGVDRALALEQEFCSDHKLFKGLERYPFALHFATRMAQTIAFAEGETIINEGSTSTRLFSLRSGTVRNVVSLLVLPSQFDHTHLTPELTPPSPLHRPR